VRKCAACKCYMGALTWSRASIGGWRCKSNVLCEGNMSADCCCGMWQAPDAWAPPLLPLL
jgi:hypothetical protein